MRPSFACVLKSGGDYKPEHVQALKKQVDLHTTIDYQFICYSDMSIDGVKVIPLQGHHKGWWAVPEIFRTQGSTVVSGIDTVIKSNIDDLFHIAENSNHSDFWMIRAFSDFNDHASGIMIWNGNWSWLWELFKQQDYTSKFRGEQDYTKYQLRKHKVEIKTINDSFPGIYSYKHHCRVFVPLDCTVMLFHGKPRPHQVPSIWEEIKNIPLAPLGYN